MKFLTIFILVLIVVTISGCFPAEKSLYIKSLNLSNNKRIDWYFNSLIGGFSESYIRFEDDRSNKYIFFESFYLSDFRQNGDTLIIEVYENEYHLDKLKSDLIGLQIKIDTNGGIWNQASSRLGRLQRKNIKVENYHFADSYCPKTECY